jgi:type IV secretion system protein VirD4
MSKKSRLSDLTFGLVMAVPVGFIFASAYATFYNGFSQAKIDRFDPFAFWYHAPFVTGYSPGIWYMGLKIIGVVCLAVMGLVFAMGTRSVTDHHGTAVWADNAHMAALGYLRAYRKITGPVFGKTSGPHGYGKYLTNGEQPHSLVVAPTRAGKGVGIVIPTLLTFDGSVVALDVKGELFELTSRARVRRGDRVYKFSPLDRNGRTHCYNPVLDIMAAPADRQFLETRRLATNLIVAKGKGSEGFIDGARDLFVAGVLACIERGTPTIGAVYDLFALPGEKYKLFAQLAEESRIPEVKRIFDNMASNDTKIITSYTSVLGDGGLNLWADQLIKRATSKSDFSIYNLRRDPTTIYIVVSPNDLEVVAPLVRLFFQQLVSILQRDMPARDETFEVLFLLDEFKHLGKLEAIETAITTIAGYKGRFMFIIQSLAALTANYEQAGKENFLGNTGVQVFMSTADDETPLYISKAIGEYTFKVKSKSYSIQERFNTNIQLSEQGAPLLRPEQIRLLDDDTQIVLVKGQPPMRMPKIKYYADRIIKRIFEAQRGPLPEPPSMSREAAPVFVAALAPIVVPIEPPVAVNAPASGGGSGGQVYSPADFDEQFHAPVPMTLEAILIASQPQDELEQQGAAMQTEKTQMRIQLDANNAREANKPAANAQQKLLEKIIALQSKTSRADSRSIEVGIGMGE